MINKLLVVLVLVLTTLVVTPVIKANDLPNYDSTHLINLVKETGIATGSFSNYYWADRYDEPTFICQPGAGGSADFEYNMESRADILAAPTVGWIKGYVGAADEVVEWIVEGEVTAIRCAAIGQPATMWIRSK